VSDLQPVDECECRYFLNTVGDFGPLALKEVYVGLEVVPEPHLDGEEVIVTPLDFLATGILCE